MLQLDEIANSIRNCVNCDLHKGRVHAVPGYGSENAEIMFIGEAPGYYEDQQGKPFVGAAGKFLDQLLALAGLDREQVYITNIVKCRPPNNRDPLPNEIDTCRAWLQQQLDTIKPKIVVTLGRYSMAYFFPGETISKIHGQQRKRDDLLIIPMYHPAAALHQERFRHMIEDDFRKLRTVLEESNKPPASGEKPAEEEPHQMRLL